MLEKSIADEVDAAIAAGSAEKHIETVRRVTDLFLLQADGYTGEQIELFGDVLERLIRTIELRALADVSARVALAEMSTQLASVKQAPPGVIRRLARHDEITIARPGTRSWATPMKVMLEPRTWRVCGVWPNGRTCTNGSFA